MHQRFAQQVRRIAQEVARGKRVGAVHDDVEAPQQLHRVVRVDRLRKRLDADVGVETQNGSRGTLDLGLVQTLHRMDYLALQVGEPHPVVVGETERPHPGRGQIQRGRRAEGANPNDQHPGLHQALLAARADLGQRQMTRVALSLVGGKRCRHQLPFDVAGAE